VATEQQHAQEAQQHALLIATSRKVAHFTEPTMHNQRFQPPTEEAFVLASLKESVK
jgi:hypothetical protein